MRHRLRAAGGDAAVFTDWALIALWYASRGLPRLINVLASKAMMLAYGRSRAHVY